MLKRLTLIILLAILLVACQPEATETATTAPDPVLPSETPEPSPVPDTATPTVTPEPSATPTEEPTPTNTEIPDLLDNYPAEGYGPIDFPENINPLTLQQHMKQYYIRKTRRN